MNGIVGSLVLGTLVFLMISATAGASSLPAPYPVAEEGVARFVIHLPHKDRAEEKGFKVELIVGRVMPTDGVNRVGLGGSIERKTLQGWGYDYYVVADLGPAMSTLIGVPQGKPKVEKFVTGPSRLIRYNSRLPVVVYVPADAEVRYRIWQASETINKADRG